MNLLITLMVVDALVHAALVLRFGGKGNEPFAVFTVVYVVLAALVFFAVPYALWIALVASVVGLVGLIVTFNSAQRDKTLDKAILVLDVAVVLWTAKLLFIA